MKRSYKEFLLTTSVILTHIAIITLIIFLISYIIIPTHIAYWKHYGTKTLILIASEILTVIIIYVGTIFLNIRERKIDAKRELELNQKYWQWKGEQNNEKTTS